MKTERFEAYLDMPTYLDQFVDLDRTQASCKECNNYKSNWACPPFDYDPIAFQETFDGIKIYLLKMSPDREGQMIDMEDYYQEVKKLNQELLEKEKEIPGSKALAAGSCHLCADLEDDPDKQTCARVQGKACRHPDQVRSSIESLGGLVGKISKEVFDQEIKWGKNGNPPPFLLLMNALLLKEKV